MAKRTMTGKADLAPGLSSKSWPEPVATGLLLLSDGTAIPGYGLGAKGTAVGEICFNTAMTGYQEIATDPSYAGQIITFTFPHIGNVGINDADIETARPAAGTGVRGLIVKADVTHPSNYRSLRHFNQWLEARGIVGVAGIDTRALTARIREHGFVNAAIAHDAGGAFDRAAMKSDLAAWPGLEGMDLAGEVTCGQRYSWDETPWAWNEGFGATVKPKCHVVVVDFGVKSNILRCLAGLGCKVTVVPAHTTAEEIFGLAPDGVVLSNGPGDPAATGVYAVPEIKQLVASGLPLFGICLGHQILGLALGAKTQKMHQGHHGANHPVKDHATGKVEIVSMNHGFAIDGKTLPDNVEETHVSLFDGSNCGLALKDRPVFSVQYHPEASPGPQDSHYLFERFLSDVHRARSAGKSA